jgi:hypothetical protein
VDFTLSLTGGQHAELRTHLFPGDGNEAAAIALCGRRAGSDRHRLLVQKIYPIPYDCCDRTPVNVSWNTDLLILWLREADREGLSVVKFHSHTSDYAHFSEQDDKSDRALFPSIDGWVEADVPHASAVMLSDGRIFGRIVDRRRFSTPLASVCVVGDDLRIWRPDEFDDAPASPIPAYTLRHAQAFGEATTRKLNRLSAAVIGCSGTGSFVISEFAHLGIGRLVLVDDDIVKEHNLNRILQATRDDLGRYKVDVLGDAVERIGLGTVVERYRCNLYNPDAVRAVAGCDVAIGCMDTVEGRFILNLLTTFYLMPYIDIGIGLEADAAGAITQVCGYIHYLQPGGSSFLSRGVFDMEDVRAEGTKRQNPEQYKTWRRAGYIKNVVEDRPAVISVNAIFASLAVNELLARLHAFRDEPNREYASLGLSLSQVAFYPEAEDGPPCRIISRHVGRGDVVPLLDQPELSEETPS